MTEVWSELGRHYSSKAQQTTGIGNVASIRLTGSGMTADRAPVRPAVQEGMFNNRSETKMLEKPNVIYDLLLKHVRDGNSDAFARCVVQNNLDVGTLARGGENALHLAARLGNERMVAVILSYPIDINKPTHETIGGHTAFHLAASAGHLGVVAALATYRANVNKPNIRGVTPLMSACGNGKQGMVELLLTLGADKDAVDQLKLTAMSHARASRNLAAIAILSVSGVNGNGSSSTRNLTIGNPSSSSTGSNSSSTPSLSNYGSGSSSFSGSRPLPLAPIVYSQPIKVVYQTQSASQSSSSSSLLSSSSSSSSSSSIVPTPSSSSSSSSSSMNSTSNTTSSSASSSVPLSARNQQLLPRYSSTSSSSFNQPDSNYLPFSSTRPLGSSSSDSTSSSTMTPSSPTLRLPVHHLGSTLLSRPPLNSFTQTVLRTNGVDPASLTTLTPTSLIPLPSPLEALTGCPTLSGSLQSSPSLRLLPTSHQHTSSPSSTSTTQGQGGSSHDRIDDVKTLAMLGDLGILSGVSAKQAALTKESTQDIIKYMVATKNAIASAQDAKNKANKKNKR